MEFRVTRSTRFPANCNSVLSSFGQSFYVKRLKCADSAFTCTEIFFSVVDFVFQNSRRMNLLISALLRLTGSSLLRVSLYYRPRTACRVLFGPQHVQRIFFSNVITSFKRDYKEKNRFNIYNNVSEKDNILQSIKLEEHNLLNENHEMLRAPTGS